jgi:hypothetical protein
MSYRHSISKLVLILVCCATSGSANDSAASTANGGIQLKREARISMEKERLTIGRTKVTVEYEFLNESDQDITTEIAFPIPAYEYEFDDTGGPRTFDDFRIWVEGQEVKYATEIKATVQDRDSTALLHKFGVDVASFGHFSYDDDKLQNYDVTKLSKTSQNTMIRAGLIKSDDLRPQWQVRKTYYWKQEFPAHKILHIRHEYTPAWGWSDLWLQSLDPKRDKKIGSNSREVQPDPIEDSCIDSSLTKRLTDAVALRAKAGSQVPEDIVIFWVDYILTTANSWKTPIKDFELVVERPKTDLSRSWYVSFCWNGKVDRVDSDHFVVRASNFVPLKELHIAFVGVAQIKATH